MTRKEILAMKPGKELDTLVSEKVMTFKIESPSAEQCNIWDGREVRYFEPSTDISAAWEVVEKMRMRTNKIYLDIRIWPDEYQMLPHQDENNKLIDRWIVKSTSLPEAICKAALLAVLEGINLPGEETTP